MPEAEGIFLDVGCGYGPIGFINCEHITKIVLLHMVDVNERAIELAKENAETIIGFKMLRFMKVIVC